MKRQLNDFANDTDADLTAYVQMYRTRIADMTPGTLTSTRDRVAFWIQLVVVFARASLLECLSFQWDKCNTRGPSARRSRPNPLPRW
jgi:hypothetical protein